MKRIIQKLWLILPLHIILFESLHPEEVVAEFLGNTLNVSDVLITLLILAKISANAPLPQGILIFHTGMGSFLYVLILSCPLFLVFTFSECVIPARNIVQGQFMRPCLCFLFFRMSDHPPWLLLFSPVSRLSVVFLVQPCHFHLEAAPGSRKSIMNQADLFE